MKLDENISIYRNDLIAAAMKQQNLSDETLAKKTGLSRLTVMFIRHGNHDAKLSTLQAIADALGLQLSELFQIADAA